MKGLIDIGIKVLSLFDGMSCGMIAFKKIGIDIDEYHAYEIDKYAIKTSKHNFPEIIHHGDVFEGDFKEYKGFDYLVGGSPCTFWSIAQSKDKRETTASGIGWELFSQYVRALHEAHPKYFLYENKENLRVVSTAQNQMNTVVNIKNTSGVKGVNWDKAENKWYARISVNGKRISIGYFDSLEEAAQARKAAEIKYYGEFRYQEEATMN